MFFHQQPRYSDQLYELTIQRVLPHRPHLSSYRGWAIAAITLLREEPGGEVGTEGRCDQPFYQTIYALAYLEMCWIRVNWSVERSMTIIMSVALITSNNDGRFVAWSA